MHIETCPHCLPIVLLSLGSLYILGQILLRKMNFHFFFIYEMKNEFIYLLTTSRLFYFNGAEKDKFGAETDEFIF
jgi:hypothetical protein